MEIIQKAVKSFNFVGNYSPIYDFKVELNRKFKNYYNDKFLKFFRSNFIVKILPYLRLVGYCDDSVPYKFLKSLNITYKNVIQFYNNSFEYMNKEIINSIINSYFFKWFVYSRVLNKIINVKDVYDNDWKYSLLHFADKINDFSSIKQHFINFDFSTNFNINYKKFDYNLSYGICNDRKKTLKSKYSARASYKPFLPKLLYNSRVKSISRFSYKTSLRRIFNRIYYRRGTKLINKEFYGNFTYSKLTNLFFMWILIYWKQNSFLMAKLVCSAWIRALVYSSNIILANNNLYNYLYKKVYSSKYYFSLEQYLAYNNKLSIFRYLKYLKNTLIFKFDSDGKYGIVHPLARKPTLVFVSLMGGKRKYHGKRIWCIK